MAQRSCGSHDHRFGLDVASRGPLTPAAIILRWSDQIEAVSAMLSITSVLGPDRRHGVNPSCMILNRAVKVQSFTTNRGANPSEDEAEHWTTKATRRGPEYLPSSGDTGLRPDSWLDFDQRASKIA